MRITVISAGVLSLLLYAPGLLAAQTARSCVDFAWAKFREEIESKSDPMLARGNEYLTAHGWISAAQTCLEFTQYPQELSQEAGNFKASVARTAQAIETAVRTDTSPPIFGSAHGAAGIMYIYPDAPPLGGETGTNTNPRPTAPFTGAFVADMVMADTATKPETSTPDVAYRMLSQREWMRVQGTLTKMGYDTGGMDGVVGARTYAAIRQYQSALGLPVTGVLDDRQLRVLLN